MVRTSPATAISATTRLAVGINRAAKARHSRRMTPPSGAEKAITSVVVALIAVAGLVLTIGEDPGRALLALLRGALGDLEGTGYTLFYATDYGSPGLP